MTKMWSKFARKSRVGEGDINAEVLREWVKVSKLQSEMLNFLHCCCVIVFRSWMHLSLRMQML